MKVPGFCFIQFQLIKERNSKESAIDVACPRWVGTNWPALPVTNVLSAHQDTTYFRRYFWQRRRVLIR